MYYYNTRDGALVLLCAPILCPAVAFLLLMHSNSWWTVVKSTAHAHCDIYSTIIYSKVMRRWTHNLLTDNMLKMYVSCTYILPTYGQRSTELKYKLMLIINKIKMLLLILIIFLFMSFHGLFLFYKKHNMKRWLSLSNNLSNNKVR